MQEPLSGGRKSDMIWDACDTVREPYRGGGEWAVSERAITTAGGGLFKFHFYCSDKNTRLNSKLGKKGSVWLPSPGQSSLLGRWKGRNLKHHSHEQRENKCIILDCLCPATFLFLYSSGLWVGNDATHSDLGLPILINNKESPLSQRLASWSTWSILFLSKSLDCIRLTVRINQCRLLTRRAPNCIIKPFLSHWLCGPNKDGWRRGHKTNVWVSGWGNPDWGQNYISPVHNVKCWALS